jgi:hypothetical protein
MYDALGHLVSGHFGIPNSAPAHVLNLSSFVTCFFILSIVFVIVARSFAYAAAEILFSDVRNV